MQNKEVARKTVQDKETARKTIQDKAKKSAQKPFDANDMQNNTAEVQEDLPWASGAWSEI